jgi:hypothetical protein
MQLHVHWHVVALLDNKSKALVCDAGFRGQHENGGPGRFVRRATGDTRTTQIDFD